MDNLNPEQIQQMIQLLQSMLTDNSDRPQNIEKKTKKKNSTGPQKSKKSKPSRENKFDEMAEKYMHKEDIAIDKKLIVQPPVPRSRKFKYVETMCRICGKKEKVNPVLITESGYKCNKCSASPG